MKNDNNIWNEFSFRKYSNRKNERELDLFDIENNETDNAYKYGIYEDLTLQCCAGIEDWFDIVREFN